MSRILHKVMVKGKSKRTVRTSVKIEVIKKLRVQNTNMSKTGLPLVIFNNLNVIY